jgi:hypothetical protein
MLIFYGGSDDEGTMNDIHLLDLKALRHLESAYRRIRHFSGLQLEDLSLAELEELSTVQQAGAQAVQEAKARLLQAENTKPAEAQPEKKRLRFSTVEMRPISRRVGGSKQCAKKGDGAAASPLIPPPESALIQPVEAFEKDRESKRKIRLLSSAFFPEKRREGAPLRAGVRKSAAEKRLRVAAPGPSADLDDSSESAATSCLAQEQLTSAPPEAMAT